jgi:hypothetical protein
LPTILVPATSIPGPLTHPEKQINHSGYMHSSS